MNWGRSLGRHRCQSSSKSDDGRHSGDQYKARASAPEPAAPTRLQVQVAPRYFARSTGYRASKAWRSHLRPRMLLASAYRLPLRLSPCVQSRFLEDQIHREREAGQDSRKAAIGSRLARTDRVGMRNPGCCAEARSSCWTNKPLDSGTSNARRTSSPSNGRRIHAYAPAKIPRTIAAICRASSGGTALPTC